MDEKVFTGYGYIEPEYDVYGSDILSSVLTEVYGKSKVSGFGLGLLKTIKYKCPEVICQVLYDKTTKYRTALEKLPVITVRLILDCIANIDEIHYNKYYKITNDETTGRDWIFFKTYRIICMLLRKLLEHENFVEFYPQMIDTLAHIYPKYRRCGYMDGNIRCIVVDAVIKRNVGDNYVSVFSFSASGIWYKMTSAETYEIAKFIENPTYWLSLKEGDTWENVNSKDIYRIFNNIVEMGGLGKILW